jgi:DNA-binding response OmpR family regulator
MLPVRVLLIEDDAPLRELTALGLRALGFHVVGAADAFDALVKLRAQGPYDALVVDDNMPGLSGRQLLRKLRSDGVTTPAIMYSGSLTLSEAECRKQGIYRVVQKPARLDDLAAVIRHMLAPEATADRG